jgi:hypothetical protein
MTVASPPVGDVKPTIPKAMLAATNAANTATVGLMSLQWAA